MHRLVPLRDGSRNMLIYRIDDLDAMPRRAGVYVFGFKYTVLGWGPKAQRHPFAGGGKA